MKRVSKAITVLMLALSLAAPTLAAEIPIERAPDHISEECIAITETIIGPVLDEVQNGLGFGEAWGKANREIHRAVLADSAGGYGYGDLSAAARNAILQYRDMYLRPGYYAEKETEVKALIQDLITAVESGTADYAAAKQEAYIRIYQSANPAYNPEVDKAGDFCYWDIPAADSVMFTQARKLLKNTRSRAGQNTINQ